MNVGCVAGCGGIGGGASCDGRGDGDDSGDGGVGVVNKSSAGSDTGGDVDGGGTGCCCG